MDAACSCHALRDGDVDLWIRETVGLRVSEAMLGPRRWVNA